MTTPSPSPDFPAAPPLPEPVTPAATAGPVCAACGDQAVVHWRRRPTEAELAEYVAAEQARRADVLALADPQLPKPQFGPLPTAHDMTRTVYSCGPHAITLDGASRIHQSTCTAPAETDLPGCSCTPEIPAGPNPEADEETTESRLPAHWLSGGK